MFLADFFYDFIVAVWRGNCSSRCPDDRLCNESCNLIGSNAFNRRFEFCCAQMSALRRLQSIWTAVAVWRMNGRKILQERDKSCPPPRMA
ncbi:Uncharacterised protein [Mycobacteroides abscessus subsp. abscessus]|nr:Uncharacterised protein [Mycobacteroides abscessus subsp. abscessus]